MEINKAWNVLKDVILTTANENFTKKYLNTKCAKSKQGMIIYKMENLITKLIKRMEQGLNYQDLIEKWINIKEEDAKEFQQSTDPIATAKEFRKCYRKEKHLLEKKHQEQIIRKAIDQRCKSFNQVKRPTINSALNRFSKSIEVDHLIIEQEIVTDPQEVKVSIDEIMKK